MTRKELFGAVGNPASSSIDISSNGVGTETAIYVGSQGKSYIVVIVNNVVSEVRQK